MRRNGFTIIEILIAVVILAIGVLGALALHATNVQGSTSVATESFAASLARSVTAALRESARTRTFRLFEQGVAVTGIIFKHDGVATGQTPSSLPYVPQTMNWQAGPFIDHPELATPALSLVSGNDDVIFMPIAAVDSSRPELDPTYVFPRPSGAAKENPRIESKTFVRGTDDWMPAGVQGYSGQTIHLDVKRTYVLTPTPGAFDAGASYSFALALRRAPVPSLEAGLSLSDNLELSSTKHKLLPGKPERRDGLYEVQILIYKNFEANPASRHHEPVKVFRTLLAVGS